MCGKLTARLQGGGGISALCGRLYELSNRPRKFWEEEGVQKAEVKAGPLSLFSVQLLLCLPYPLSSPGLGEAPDKGLLV